MESATGYVEYTYTNQFAARCVAVSSSYSREFYPSFQKYFKQMELSNSLGELYVCLYYYHYYYYYYSVPSYGHGIIFRQNMMIVSSRTVDSVKQVRCRWKRIQCEDVSSK